MHDRAGIYFIYVLQEYVHFYVGFLEKKGNHELTSLRRYEMCELEAPCLYGLFK